MILVKLREIFFLTIHVKIDDKNLKKKNREQRIFRVNENLICLKI